MRIFLIESSIIPKKDNNLSIDNHVVHRKTHPCSDEFVNTSTSIYLFICEKVFFILKFLENFSLISLNKVKEQRRK